MKKYILILAAIASIPFGISSCGKETTTTTSSTCTLVDNTTATSTVNSYGCYLLTRDTSSCQSSRTAQGLSGFWLKFSCLVTLTKSGSNVVIATDSRPDSKSQYFGSSNVCYEAFSASGRITNPNSIAAQSISATVPYAAAAAGSNTATSDGVIGVALNGVSIYDNTAAPGDDIYDEVQTFDKCQGHPDSNSRYHYHTEPDSITSSDYAFVGVMRDGFPIYGRKDADGSTPVLDAAGGHTGTTTDSSGASIYHYHVNLQTSGSDSAYFVSLGYYHGTAGTCTGCL